MRLIDADALIKEFERYMLDPKELRDAIHTINYAPVVDAVPVIRCKDCIRWRRSKSNTAAKVCDWDRYEKTENDYCSWAKRREDD